MKLPVDLYQAALAYTQHVARDAVMLPAVLLLQQVF